ncbi:hypothetical protein PIB30_083520, partial [Stylosanthes scabra]|nr:hypothetical protein [Stylosanthes scabra]
KESMCYCLLHCNSSKEVWGLSPLTGITSNHPATTFKECWQQMTISTGYGRYGD